MSEISLSGRDPLGLMDGEDDLDLRGPWGENQGRNILLINSPKYRILYCNTPSEVAAGGIILSCSRSRLHIVLGMNHSIARLRWERNCTSIWV